VDEAGRRDALAFETCHPVVPAVYFAGIIGIGIFTLQPVFAAISVVGALCFAVCCTGWRRALRQLRWQLPMIALVCLANPLFSSSGLTVLITLGPVTVRLEALAYGLCMGASLVSMLQWVANAAHVLTEDRLLELSGTRLPVVTTMVSMAIQLVPQLRRRFGVVESARGACTSAQAPRKGGHVHASTVLMAWAMEDSLERADSMRARGWELGGHRTGYRLEPLRGSDVAAAAAVGLLAFAAALAAYVAQAEWSFYPTMPALRPWWGYVPFALLALLPTALTLVLRLKEGRLGSVENR
jgi:energy-coupling factor transport system permease protein